MLFAEGEMEKTGCSDAGDGWKMMQAVVVLERRWCS